jgi:hypothetical protein
MYYNDASEYTVCVYVCVSTTTTTTKPMSAKELTGEDAVELAADMRDAANIGTEIPLPPDHVITVAGSAEKFDFTADINHKTPVRTTLLRVKKFQLPGQIGKSAGSGRSRAMSFMQSGRND